jgi:hypothetical protein
VDHDLVARELIRALRGPRSQTAFSRRLGYRSNVAYAWESGRRWPTAAEALRAAQRVGIDVTAALTRFYRTAPPWLGELDPTTPAAVAAMLRDLQGRTPLVRVAEASGMSRFAASRALQGRAEPSLPDFLRLVDATSLRALDWIACFVDPAGLPSAAAAWQRLEAQRRLMYELPWTQAVLRALELADYAALPEHRPGWIAERLGIPVEAELGCIEAMAAAGQIRDVRGRWVPTDVLAVDTRRDPAAGRRLKRWWATVGLERLERDDPGLFSYNVFTVSEADLDRLRELHLGYFRELRAIVAASTPGDRVVVANLQLFALDRPGG